VPYSPLGRGFLTGTAKRAEELPADDWRAKGDPRLQGKNFDENMKLAELVRQFAEEKSATPGQVALAWLLHQGYDVVPLPGTKRRNTWRKTSQPLRLNSHRLTWKVGGFVSSHKVSGLRYNPADVAAINR
jgi:aryl-alcohol dehydrogenase-like predicted oxidoreductase